MTATAQQVTGLGDTFTNIAASWMTRYRAGLPRCLPTAGVPAQQLLADGIEHRTIIQEVQANLEGADHPEPVVEKTFLRFAAATGRDEAIKLADAGDTAGAATVLSKVAEQFAPYLDDAEMVQEREDLTQDPRERVADGEQAECRSPPRVLGRHGQDEVLGVQRLGAHALDPRASVASLSAGVRSDESAGVRRADPHGS